MANKILYSSINYPAGVQMIFARVINEGQMREWSGNDAPAALRRFADVVHERAATYCIPMRVDNGNEVTLYFDRFVQDDYGQVYADYKCERL